MSQLTGTRIFNAIQGLFSSLDATDALLLKRVLGVRFKHRVALGDRGATATSVGLTTFYNNDSGVSLKLVSAQLLTPTTIAPGATNNVAFVLDKVDSAGANAANLATYTSDVAGGTATADVPKAFTMVGGTSTATVVASGWSLRASATKGGSGVIISDGEAPCILEVTMEYDT